LASPALKAGPRRRCEAERANTKKKLSLNAARKATNNFQTDTRRKILPPVLLAAKAVGAAAEARRGFYCTLEIRQFALQN
jgi:hypothetical protein